MAITIRVVNHLNKEKITNVHVQGHRNPATAMRIAGWWMEGDFTLIDDQGATIKTAKYWGKEVYATREDAKCAALDSARRIVDENS